VKISTKNIEFSYGKDKILNKVDLNVFEGELIAIIGPNGTGKSTFIKCINGLLKADHGQVEIDNLDIKGMTQGQIAKKISYVPQSTSNIFNLTVLDMVLLGRRPHSSFNSVKQDRISALQALNALNIEHLAMRSFNNLSGGQQQKVVIARALAQEAGIILLDEPISNLDISHQIEVLETLKNLVDKRGISVLLILHDLNIASQYSHRIVMMNHGKVFSAGTPQEVLTHENIHDVYGIDVSIIRRSEKPYIIPFRV